MIFRHLSCLTSFGLLQVSILAAEITTISSPDESIQVTLASDSSGSCSYAIEANGRKLIASSALGIDFGPAGKLPGKEWRSAKSTSRTVDTTWKPLWGKRAVVRDRYREAVWEMSGPDAPFDKMTVILRVYDDGVAFRYGIPATAKGNPVRAVDDLTEFNFAGDFITWGYNNENHNHGPEKLSAIRGIRKPVVVAQAAENAFVAIHEADLRSGYPLELSKSGKTSFRAHASPGELRPGHVGPWRVIFVGTSPGALVDSHLLELLNPESEGDFSWVKTGVAVWDWRIDGAEVPGFKYGMNLPSWIRMVDFAAANGIKHLVLDANWYGPEFGKDSDPVKGDKANDVRKIIDYGKRKSVGVWLYLNDIGGRKFPLEDTLAHYEDWGASGVKYGFMTGTPEEKNTRTRTITELCAKHKLLCNFHDEPVHPYGQMRTWPNAVTREFCWAQLDAKKVFGPKTFVTSVFVNMIAGPIDMNNGMFDLRQGNTTRVDNNQEVPSTLVSEAARTLITFSGATILPDIPEFYQKYPDLLEFIAAQQMPWRESKTLSGVIGEYIVMARQSSKGVWLVGAATNEEGREIDIPLGFLPEGKWNATIVQDGESGHYLTQRETFHTEKRMITRSETIRVKLAPGGGACVLIEGR